MCIRDRVYAGGFYVVVDPTLPASRIQSIFCQLQPEMVVTAVSYTHLDVYKRQVSESACGL